MFLVIILCLVWYATETPKLIYHWKAYEILQMNMKSSVQKLPNL